MNPDQLIEKIFRQPDDFDGQAMEVFHYQFGSNPVYREFVRGLGLSPEKILSAAQIPFLPISFFKNHRVLTAGGKKETVFSSSATTGTEPAKHYVRDLEVYRRSFTGAFSLFYGPPSGYCILALLPSYLERKGSSLVYMVNELIGESRHPSSGFYLHHTPELLKTLEHLETSGQKTLLIGVSFALAGLAEQLREAPLQLQHTIIMETGGMKGRRKEIIREELHELLTRAFGVKEIHSEYGMTELLSQAYSKGGGVFQTPPWMKAGVRDINDPRSDFITGRTGGLCITDLANIHSCSFIATQDLGRMNPDGTFEILGRFDYSDTRGCNLMV